MLLTEYLIWKSRATTLAYVQHTGIWLCHIRANDWYAHNSMRDPSMPSKVPAGRVPRSLSPRSLSQPWRWGHMETVDRGEITMMGPLTKRSTQEEGRSAVSALAIQRVRHIHVEKGNCCDQLPCALFRTVFFCTFSHRDIFVLLQSVFFTTRRKCFREMS